MELITLPPLMNYWKDRDRPQYHSFEDIDWDSMQRAMKALPFGIQKWTTKHTVGMCSVGKFRSTWGLDKDNMCPRCGDPEDHLHVPRCQGKGVQEKWDHEITALRQWMVSHHTAPAIISALISILQEVRRLPRLPFTSRERPVQEAVQSQYRISAQGLLEGRLSVLWLPLQQAHFSSLGRRNSGSLWASRLIQQLILIGFHMWEHRNGVQHSEDNRQLLSIRTALDQSITDQFDMGPSGLSPQIRPMLLRPMKEVLALPVDDKKIWVGLVTRSRRSRRRALSRQKAMIYKISRRRASTARR